MESWELGEWSTCMHCCGLISFTFVWALCVSRLCDRFGSWKVPIQHVITDCQSWYTNKKLTLLMMGYKPDLVW